MSTIGSGAMTRAVQIASARRDGLRMDGELRFVTAGKDGRACEAEHIDGGDDDDGSSGCETGGA